MEETINPSMVQIVEEVNGWREAVRVTAAPLLKEEFIQESYIDAMIQNVEEMGAYIVLAPRVAVPHARPEKGVSKTGMSVMKLNTAVDFNVEGEEDPERLVRLIFVLAATDNESHIGILQKLSMILDNDETIDALIESGSIEELVDLLNK